MKHTRFKASIRRLAPVAGLLSTGLLGAAQAQQTPAYSGPQAVVYIGDNYCSGGYCGYSVWSSFDTAMTQALKASGYVRPVRQQDGANLIMKAGINDITGGGGVCLPLVGLPERQDGQGQLRDRRREDRHGDLARHLRRHQRRVQFVVLVERGEFQQRREQGRR